MHLFIKSALGTETRFEWLIREDDIDELEEACQVWFNNNDVASNGGMFFTIEDDDENEYERQVLRALLDQRNKRSNDAEDVGWIGQIMHKVEASMEREECAVLLAMVRDDWELGDIRDWMHEEDYEHALASTEASEVFNHFAEVEHDGAPEWLSEYVDHVAFLDSRDAIRQVALDGDDYWVYLNN